MKFGILYNVDYRKQVHGTPSEYYAMLLDQIEVEEQLGFDSVWFGEHHYNGYAFGSPPVIAMAAAARTKRIRLGTGVSLVPLSQPIRFAEEYAMLDVLSGGRLEYGIGRGFLKYAHEVMGVSEEENRSRYEEGAELILKAWTANEPFDFAGQHWSLKDYSFFPKPIQAPHPPIYASGVITPESFAWAGKKGFHLSTGFFLPARERVRDGIALYRKTLVEYGHDPETRDVAGVFQMYCGETNAEARRNGGEYVLNYLEYFRHLAARSNFTTSDFSAHQRGSGSVDRMAGYDDMDRQNLVMIGDPDNLIERIKWAREYYGTNYLIFEIAQGGMSPDKVIPSLERFARYVMPEFKQD
ncbi:MAG: LLM class flavin-dependent oxidoreductase [Pseudomonadales bacterium]|nr:LLM class flavin-dependent oxidoreductase [Pseudomonadales bacterium]